MASLIGSIASASDILLLNTAFIQCVCVVCVCARALSLLFTYPHLSCQNICILEITCEDRYFINCMNLPASTLIVQLRTLVS